VQQTNKQTNKQTRSFKKRNGWVLFFFSFFVKKKMRPLKVWESILKKISEIRKTSRTKKRMPLIPGNITTFLTTIHLSVTLFWTGYNCSMCCQGKMNKWEMMDWWVWLTHESKHSFQNQNNRHLNIQKKRMKVQCVQEISYKYYKQVPTPINTQTETNGSITWDTSKSCVLFFFDEREISYFVEIELRWNKWHFLQ
jgi:hypothetical protein